MWSVIHEGTDCASQLKLLRAAAWSRPSPGQSGQFSAWAGVLMPLRCCWESPWVVLGHSHGTRWMKTTEERTKQALGGSSRKFSRVWGNDLPSFNNSSWSAEVYLTLLPVLRCFGFGFGFCFVFFFFGWLFLGRKGWGAGGLLVFWVFLGNFCLFFKFWQRIWWKIFTIWLR